MNRVRTFNASPARSSSETVAAINSVIAESLASGGSVSTPDVEAAISDAEQALLMLVSGRHVKKHPITLVAGDSMCEFFCRYDAGAVGGDENLNPVPGFASADSFTLHIPAPEPLTATITAMVSGRPHLSVEPASKPSVATLTAPQPLDLAALKERL